MSQVRTEDLLVVEDDPSHAELILSALRENGLTMKVRVARDGAEAAAYLALGRKKSVDQAERLPGLILLDLKLPRMDGFSLLRKIRANERTSHIPVVILTSSQEPRDIAESYRLGANSYVVKPVDFDQFLNAVKVIGSYWLQCNEPLLQP